jgi:hypothetical protein
VTWPLARLAAALRSVGLAIEAPHAAWCLLGTDTAVLATRRAALGRVQVILPWGPSDDLHLWGRRHPRIEVRREQLTPLTPAAVTVLLASPR